MNYSNTNPDYLSSYRNEMERQAIEQAQEFLRRYGIFTPNGQQTAPSQPSSGMSGDLVTIPVASLEQAENAPVDAFRTFLYPNFQASEIYLKKVGEDGKHIVQTYLPKGLEQSKAFEDITKKILATMSYIDERMKSMEEKFDKHQSRLKGENKNDE